MNQRLARAWACHDRLLLLPSSGLSEKLRCECFETSLRMGDEKFQRTDRASTDGGETFFVESLYGHERPSQDRALTKNDILWATGNSPVIELSRYVLEALVPR
jgi:hypothetical protein